MQRSRSIPARIVPLLITLAACGGGDESANVLPSCSSVIQGPYSPPQPQYPTLQALCEADAGTPLPAFLVPPDSFPDGEEIYTQQIQEFLRARTYDTELHWVHDYVWRLTGPYQGCPPEGMSTHLDAVRIFYSPEVVAWMCNGRQGELPEGAMIVKEQRPFDTLGVDAQGLAWLPQKQFQAGPTSWTVMVRGSGISHDDWFWAFISKDPDTTNPPLYGRSAVTSLDFFSNLALLEEQDPSRYPTGDQTETKEGSIAFRQYQFGNYCINCHASAASGSTFVTTDNITGPEQRYTYSADAVELVGETPHPGQDVDLALHDYPAPLLAPTSDFLTAFPQFAGAGAGIPFADVLETRFPAQSYDHALATPGQNAEQFLTSDQCIGCHDATEGPTGPPNMTLQDEQLEQTINLSPYAEWSVSPMGLAGRDPIFLAQLETERNLEPGKAECIEDLCSSCHAVMGKRQLALDHPADTPLCPELLDPTMNPASFLTTEPFTRQYLREWSADAPVPGESPANKYGGLGRDGISCTVCHHVDDPNLGEPSSYTGAFEVGPPGTLFGPYTDPKAKPMQNALGITPQPGEQIGSSALCGSCHAISLPVFDNTGAFREFAFEQATYLEQQNSDYKDTTCQSCHMPTTYHQTELDFAIANIEDPSFPFVDHRLPDADIALPTHSPYGRHTLYGLNLFLNGMFQQFPLLLGFRQIDFMNPDTRPALFTAREAVLDVAENSTAQIQVDRAELVGDVLEVDVTITSQVGHKLPSGVGFRRMFVELLVLDASGDASHPIWASGRTNSVGVLLEGTTDTPLATEFFEESDCANNLQNQSGQCYQPHYQVITSPDQVQIYEELVTDNDDATSAFTDSFLHRVETLKDNRILPKGFDVGAAIPDLLPDALTLRDPDYSMPADGVSGQDHLSYQIALTPEQAAGVAGVSASLHYQAIPPHYLKARFDDALAGQEKEDTMRLYYLTSRLDTAALDDAGKAYLDQWKLQIGVDDVVDVPFVR